MSDTMRVFASVSVAVLGDKISFYHYNNVNYIEVEYTGYSLKQVIKRYHKRYFNNSVVRYYIAFCDPDTGEVLKEQIRERV